MRLEAVGTDEEERERNGEILMGHGCYHFCGTALYLREIFQHHCC